MNKITQVYTNGCSYTYDNYIYHNLKSNTYGEELAQQYGAICLNMGLPGSCNRRIIRTTLRDALTFTSQTLVIVQLTVLYRTEKSFTPGQDNEWKMGNPQSLEEYHESLKGNKHEKFNQEYYNMHIKFFDDCAALTDLAADLIMLTTYLQHHRIPYYIFNYSMLPTKDVIDQIYNNKLQQQLRKDENVMNILTDSLTSRLGTGNWYYDESRKDYTGHLNPAGHIRAAEILHQLITKN
jgi:hypothetical protein